MKLQMDIHVVIELNQIYKPLTVQQHYYFDMVDCYDIIKYFHYYLLQLYSIKNEELFVYLGYQMEYDYLNYLYYQDYLYYPIHNLLFPIGVKLVTL